jgi:catalase
MKTMASRTALFPYEEPKMFIMDSFRHGKPIAASGQGVTLLESANIDLPDRKDDMSELDGVILGSDESKVESAFKKALIQQRYWSRLPLDNEM